MRPGILCSTDVRIDSPMRPLLKMSLLFTLFSLALLPGLLAQHADSMQAPFRRFPTVPPLNLLKVDSASYLTNKDLKKGRLTMIMYFSPECEHCKHQTEDLLASMDQFKNIEIVMATVQPFAQMKDFYNYYRIAEHPNIKMGRDEKAVLPGFYRIRSLPYIALYDKKGNFITSFEGNQKTSTLLTAFNKAD